MSTVAAPTVPLYDMGALTMRVRPRATQVVREPAYPLYDGWALHGLGFNPAILIGPVVVSKSQGTASSAAESAAAGASQGFAVGGPIGAAIGAIAGAIAGIFGSHAARAKSAQTEDAAVNIAVEGFDAALQALNQAVKSGQIDPNSALQVAQQNILPGYWSVVSTKIQPGRNGCVTGSACPVGTPGNNPCQGNIGAACCVGCYDIELSMTDADGVFAALAGQSTHAAGKYVSRLAAVNASKYGGKARSEYTLDWTPPASSSASGILSDLTGGSGGSSLFPLALAALVAFVALK